MAVLQQSISRSMNPFAERIGDDVAPAGTWVATIVDIRDEFGVTRPKYENPQETEVVDLTCFLFGFRDQGNQPHLLASRTMRISGNEKSTLFGFLKAILGRAPQYGWDYCELKGTRCLLTVEHAPRRDGSGVFPSVAALSPVPTGFAGPARQEPAAGGRGTGDGRQSRAEARRRRGERLRISRIARMGRRETVSRGGAETQRREATDFADSADGETGDSLTRRRGGAEERGYGFRGWETVSRGGAGAQRREATDFADSADGETGDSLARRRGGAEERGYGFRGWGDGSDETECDNGNAFGGDDGGDAGTEEGCAPGAAGRGFGGGRRPRSGSRGAQGAGALCGYPGGRGVPERERAEREALARAGPQARWPVLLPHERGCQLPGERGVQGQAG